MRWLLLALPASFCSTGCAGLINASGTRLDQLQTADDVHHTFGSPIASGKIGDQPYEDFRSHRKIACIWMGEYYLMTDAATLGFAELILVPREIFLAAKQIIGGQDLRIVYSPDGKVDSVYVNGQRDSWSGNRGQPIEPVRVSKEPAPQVDSKVKDYTGIASPP
jgi:hypothetical protein